MMGDQVEAGQPATPSDGLYGEALDVLIAALEWKLTENRWDIVAQAVDALARALRSGDVGALRKAVSDLELVGPVRATGIGQSPTVPAPEPVREEINELIHTVGGRVDGQS